MFDDYDTTDHFISYYKTFDITDNQDAVIDEILDGYEYKDECAVKLRRLITKAQNGIKILDSRYISNIGVRYCQYFSETDIRWYMLRIWRTRGSFLG